MMMMMMMHFSVPILVIALEACIQNCIGYCCVVCSSHNPTGVNDFSLHCCPKSKFPNITSPKRRTMHNGALSDLSLFRLVITPTCDRQMELWSTIVKSTAAVAS